MKRLKKAVTQEDLMGCGIACVAFILNKNYKTVKKKYFISFGNANKRGYFCRDLVKVLSQAGKKYYFKYIKKRINFKEDYVVFIKRSKRYPVGHYLVRTKDGWMDPWINFSRLNQNIKTAKSGFRKKLPGRAIYAIIPIK